MRLTSGERFGQGLSQGGRGGPQLCIFRHQPHTELLRQCEKACVVGGRAIAKCCIQSSLMTDTKQVGLEKRCCAVKAIARPRCSDVARPFVSNQHIAEFDKGERLGSPDRIARKQLCHGRAACAPHVKRRNNVCIDEKHAKPRDQSRPHAMAASMSSVVGVNPPRSFTGLGAFAGRVLLAAMPLRMNSAIASFNFFCSCTARILTSRMRSSGRSSVVFIRPDSQKAGFLSNSCRPSLRFLFAEFLEARIIPQRIEHGIEPEERGSERHVFSECASAGNREYFL